MNEFHNTIIDMMMNYLDNNTNGEIEACYFNKCNTTPFEEIDKWIEDSCIIENLYQNYPDMDLSTMTADTVLEIQKKVKDEYDSICIGDSLYRKDDLICLYMCRDVIVDEITKKYDIIKIQRLWRGYDCRWKNPFLMLTC